jgi:hypothetical protein
MLEVGWFRWSLTNNDATGAATVLEFLDSALNVVLSFSVTVAPGATVYVACFSGAGPSYDPPQDAGLIQGRATGDHVAVGMPLLRIEQDLRWQISSTAAAFQIANIYVGYYESTLRRPRSPSR